MVVLLALAKYSFDALGKRRIPLKADFHLLEIPMEATLMGQYVLGSSSGPSQGVLVNTWTGQIQINAETGTRKF